MINFLCIISDFLCVSKKWWPWHTKAWKLLILVYLASIWIYTAICTIPNSKSDCLVFRDTLLCLCITKLILCVSPVKSAVVQDVSICNLNSHIQCQHWENNQGMEIHPRFIIMYHITQKEVAKGHKCQLCLFFKKVFPH